MFSYNCRLQFLKELRKHSEQHLRVSAQPNKKNFQGQLNMIYCQSGLSFSKVYPGFTLLSIFLRDLSDRITEGLQIFCHGFQKYKEGDMTAANQTPATVAEGAKDCNELFYQKKSTLSFKTL